MNRRAEDWKYFRAGGVVQVDLKTAEDLSALSQLDQKLWMALSMPTRGLSAEQRTLDAMDTDLDGRIRPPEVLAAIEWLLQRVSHFDPQEQASSSLAISALTDPVMRGLAQSLADAKGQGTEISLSEVDQKLAQLTQEPFNGDGVIVPACTETSALKELIETLIALYPGVLDRSGAHGVDRNTLQCFKTEREQQLAWHESGLSLLAGFPCAAPAVFAAADAWSAVAPKIDDYFTRCRWLEFDRRAEQAANRSEADFDAIGKGLLNVNTAALADLPLAHIEAGRALALDHTLNPAWSAAIQNFVNLCLKPLFHHDGQKLFDSQWEKISAQMQSFVTWRKLQPTGPLASWSHEQLQGLSQELLDGLDSLITQDEALQPEYAQLKDLLYVLLLRRDLGRILRNFINFSDFYRGQKALFQVGSLYIDGRTLDLCVDVSNPAKHTSIAGLAGAYLLYCECKRPGQPNRSIVALLTDGTSDNIMVGRNGVFYDLDGNDWDASVTRIIANPISLREAFWMPYKSLARLIEEQVAKRAGAAQQASQGQLSKTAETIAHAEKKDATDSTLAKSKFDPGTIAALGVALGSIGTFLGLIFSKFIDLGLLMPLGILALTLMISGPSVLLAWLKLRNRNLGPILDANGWAINTAARINVPFAASMTQLRQVPLRAEATLTDPYAEAKRPWKTYCFLGLLVALVSLWLLGKCDAYLPHKLKQKTVFAEAKAVETP